MRYISLFSGIGGVDLGLDRAGMKCVAQVEQNKFALKVLNKHWPDVPKFEDVREYDPEPGECEVVAGGFPCQDISNAANNRQGLGGERSGLWWEMLRIIERAKPAFVFIENVSQLRRMGLGIVLRELSEIGYNAEWETIRAAQIGLPHKRSRLFIVAYANSIDGFARGDNESRFSVADRPEWVTQAAQCESGWELQRWLVETYAALDFSPSNPGTYRGIDGIPNRVDRLRGCGNAVVPQIAELIGRRIMELGQ
tara:strand:+ start:864 stop:1622 length:759 start_codon:yes stop_codon:yes gene_type:complete